MRASEKWKDESGAGAYFLFQGERERFQIVNHKIHQIHERKTFKTLKTPSLAGTREVYTSLEAAKATGG